MSVIKNFYQLAFNFSPIDRFVYLTQKLTKNYVLDIDDKTDNYTGTNKFQINSGYIFYNGWPH